jgi:hypothetical protein
VAHESVWAGAAVVIVPDMDVSAGRDQIEWSARRRRRIHLMRGAPIQTSAASMNSDLHYSAGAYRKMHAVGLST